MFTELHPMDPPEESKLDLGINSEDVLSRRDRLNKTTGIIVPYSMTRSGQHDEASKRKKIDIDLHCLPAMEFTSFQAKNWLFCTRLTKRTI